MVRIKIGTVLQVITVAGAMCITQFSKSHADPDPTVKYLMNTPVSQFTLGMVRLNSDLNGRYRQRIQGEGTILASYNWDRNRITVLFIAEDLSEERCAELVNAIRRIGGVNSNSGEAFLENSFFSDYFGPQGYTKANQPDDVWEKLDQLFEIRVASISNQISCQGPLISSKVLFER